MVATTPDPPEVAGATPAPPEPPAPEGLVLAGEFAPVDRAQWVALAREVLVRAGRPGDVDPVAALTRYEPGGIDVAPLYLREDTPDVAPVTRAPGTLESGAWDVRVRHDDPDPDRANAAVLADLQGGATSLWLRVGSGAIDPADLPRVLDGVLLDLVTVHLDAEPDVGAALAGLAAAAGGTAVGGSAGADPLGWAFRTGATDAAPGSVARDRPGVTAGLRAVTVDATAYQDAGASDVTAIALATAAGVAYLRALDGDLDAVEFRFAVTDRQFPSVAALRAARRVWARVAELCGAPGVAQVQHAVTSAAMLARRDPFVNLLRTTVAGFAAVVGGADAVTVLPFDAALGRPEAFARRLARNVQAILHDEASMARVLDPAAGSWYVESLTDRIAQRAWDEFTALERAGGIVAALRNGEVAAAVAASAAERARDVATGRRPITGVSEFPDLAEPELRREPAPPVPGLVRWAAPYEQLRDRSDRVLAATGRRPRVDLLVVGARAAASARVSFATNLFHAGGVEVDVVTDGAACTAALVCLCGTDAAYAEHGVAAAAAAAAGGARAVWLAGRVEVAGVGCTVHAGGDALADLTRAWDLLGEQVPA